MQAIDTAVGEAVVTSEVKHTAKEGAAIASEVKRTTAVEVKLVNRTDLFVEVKADLKSPSSKAQEAATTVRVKKQAWWLKPEA